MGSAISPISMSRSIEAKRVRSDGNSRAGDEWGKVGAENLQIKSLGLRPEERVSRNKKKYDGELAQNEERKVRCLKMKE